MRENLAQFQERTSFVYNRLPVYERFMPSEGAAAKVNGDPGDAYLLPFFGDTVIFDLDSESKKWLTEVQDILYAYCGRYTLLSKRLTEESFHITLHDLTWRLPEDVHEILDDLEQREKQVNALLDAFRKAYPDGVRVKATSMMNMVNTSAVLAFEPVSEDDCAALTDMYTRLHAVVPLAHGITPHVTIAYYRPDDNGYGADVTQALQEAIDLVNARYQGREFVLSMDRVRYSCFADMNTYCSRKKMIELVKGGLVR